MKFSEAMLKGFEKVGGRQCRGYMEVRHRGRVTAHCAVGAAVRGGMTQCEAESSNGAMRRAWGPSAIFLNDVERMPWEHIYGMARAVGL